MRLLRDHGRDEEGEVVSWGRNSHLGNLQANVLDFKLARVEKAVARRREVAARYHQVLISYSAVKLPPEPDHGALGLVGRHLPSTIWLY